MGKRRAKVGTVRKDGYAGGMDPAYGEALAFQSCAQCGCIAMATEGGIGKVYAPPPECGCDCHFTWKRFNHVIGPDGVEVGG